MDENTFIDTFFIEYELINTFSYTYQDIHDKITNNMNITDILIPIYVPLILN